MSTKVTRCFDADFDDIVRFVTRLNTQPDHHIGFFGASEADIRQTLAELEPSVHESSVVAEEDGNLVGLMGVEYDVEIGRAWLYGPLIDHSDWQVLADRLYAAVQPLLPDVVREHDLFCDTRNQNVRAFADRRSFALRSENAILNLDRAQFAVVPQLEAEPFTAPYFARLEALHDHLFPRTYYTARQLVDKQDADTFLFIASDGGELMGYVFGKVQRQAEQGYVDFLGVADSQRRRGVGRRLLSAAVRRIAEAPEVQTVNLTMNTHNTAAMSLYANLGFTVERTMMGFRRQV